MAPQPDDATLHDLIGLIYEAAVDPARWPGFLAALAEALGAAGTKPWLRDFASWGAQVHDGAEPMQAAHVDPSCQELHRRLLPHLRRAREMQRRLAQQSLGRCGALEALDSLAGGVMVLDGTGCVCYANKEAEKLLAAGQGLRLDQAGSVRTVMQWQNETLYRLIGHAAAGERKLENRGCLRVSRAQGQPLALLMAPFQDKGAGPGEMKTGALVFIHDPDATPAPLADTVRWHFELTPTQARLAGALAAGDSLAECARAMRISVATARTHLKEVFAKTGARRQADLVRLLLSSPLFHARGDSLSDQPRNEARPQTAETASASPPA
jgi:DNA-binding CsgD family transcriptional regulator/PAS domain-containing protein